MSFLILTRKENEDILIGENIRVRVFRVDGRSVKIGIEAPKETVVLRGELVGKERRERDRD